MSLRGGFLLAGVLLFGGTIAGCGSASEAPPGTAGKPASAGSSAAAATDSGAQTVSGKAPPATGSYPAIVMLEPVGGADPAPQAARPVMDQVQQTFIPPILLVRTGQPVDFLNNDDVLHNVRVKDAESRESAFNVAIPTGERYTHVFNHDGFYDVGCDIHPGMSAQIMAATTPYVVVADPSGAFTIAHVPNGPYKATAFAGAQKIEKDIDVVAGLTPLDLTHQ